MNCSACGTQLPQGAANCPQCGATTPYSYSQSGTAPNDPTVVSSPYADAQQPLPSTVYGSQSYGVRPPTPYDTPPYGAALRALYDSPPYQNPYEPYNVAPLAPPPPSSQRPGKRIGIIAGVVLLVLLLIGGGVFAWFEYSLTRNAAEAAAIATTTAHTNAIASATAAAQHFTAKGTATIVSNTTTSVRQDGQNRIYSITQQDVSYGDITGSFTSEETSILHPDNTADFSGRSTCSCTVDGKSGTLLWSFSGTSTANGSFQGQFFDIHGTGDLAKLHGQGVFQGQGLHETYSSELYFDL
jgi:Flp pilus assembly protein TadG